MLSPEILIQAHRRLRSRPLKVLAMAGMRALGLRHLVIRLDTINLCNLRCKMCYYSSDSMRKKEEMDLPLFRKIADEVFPKTRFLYLSCATEPLMNKQFARIVEATGEYLVPFTSFCTNGQLLKEDVIQASIQAKLSEIIFSIDGATPATYEEIRRGGKFDRIVEKLDLLASMKRQAKSQQPIARINFTCMQRNIRELPAMAHFAADHGVRSLHVRHLLAYTDERNSCRKEMRYLQEFNSVAGEARHEAKLRGIDLFLPDPVSGASGGQRDGGDSRRSEANPYCLLPWLQGIIAWNGDYRVCSFQNRLGNFQEQTFDEIYGSSRMREIRRMMLSRSPGSCSWDCHQEAYEASEEQEPELVDIDPRTDT